MGRKKIFLINNNKKPFDIKEDLHTFLTTSYKSTYQHHSLPFWDDDDDERFGYWNRNYYDDYYEDVYGCGSIVYPKTKTVKEINDTEAAYLNDNTVIKFYEDYSDSYTYKTFKTLYEFNEYTVRRGITVTQEQMRKMLRHPLIHCCIDEEKQIKEGKLCLIIASTYFDMVKLASESESKFCNSYPTSHNFLN